MESLDDIGVLGSGPAALTMAAELAKWGASVTLVAPEPSSAWKPNYCLWHDELPAEWLALCERVWPTACVATPAGERTLERRYAKLDTRAFQQTLWDIVNSTSARVVSSPAVSLEHRADRTSIRAEDGSVHQVRVVVDASGYKTPFVNRVHRRPPAFQIAYGLLLHAPSHPFETGRLVLMDFRPADDQDAEPPSFLYVLPMADGRLFLEETSLASRPAMQMDVLQRRLEQRLAALGLHNCHRLEEEHCSIPMGLGLPTTKQRVVPFGTAASMVHPASGYQMARVLQKARPMARSILDGLDVGGPQAAVAVGNHALWSKDERVAWELYGFGLEALLGMSSHAIARFFDSFFELPVEAWSGFLGGTLSPSALRSVMTRHFRLLPAPVQWHLVRKSLSAGAAPLARSVFQDA